VTLCTWHQVEATHDARALDQETSDWLFGGALGLGWFPICPFCRDNFANTFRRIELRDRRATPV